MKALVLAFPAPFALSSASPPPADPFTAYFAAVARSMQGQPLRVVAPALASIVRAKHQATEGVRDA